MKLATPLLLVSVAANAALIVAVSQRPAPPTATSGFAVAVRSRGAASSAEALRAALASGDPAALEAAGLSPELARELGLGRTFARLAERLHAARSEASNDGRWWRSRAGAPADREADAQARRELSEALTSAFGDDFGVNGGEPSRFSFLPLDKRSALRRITQDYDEMMAKFSAGGIQLASDRQKLELLKAERERDIAALLTPAEYVEYEMRTSRSAAMLRARYGDGINSEEDFRRLFGLQKSFDEKYPMPNGRLTPESMQERAQAQRQLQAEQRAAVGSETFAAMLRAADPDLRTVDALAARLNLPGDTTDRVVAERDRLAAASQKIALDASLTLPQRQAQLQGLGQEARTRLAGLFGQEAADAYAQRSPWLNMLQGGMGFSTNPADGPMGLMPGGPSVVPVMPAGMAGPGNRTVMNFAIANDTSATATPAAGGVFFSTGSVISIDGGPPGAMNAVTIEKSAAPDLRAGTLIDVVPALPLAPAGGAAAPTPSR